LLQALGFVTSSRLCYWARGPWGPLGPRCRIRVATVTTYCQAGFQPYETCTQQPHTCTQTFPHTDYLLSGKATYSQAKLPTVRQSYLQSGKATYSQAKLPTVRHAPNNRIHAPNRAIDMHPKGIDMHPKVSIDFAPNFRILCTQPSHRHAPKRHRLCTQK